MQIESLHDACICLVVVMLLVLFAHVYGGRCQEQKQKNTSLLKAGDFLMRHIPNLEFIHLLVSLRETKGTLTISER